MDVKTLLLVIFASLALASDLEDSDQKKRATAKGTPINSIPTGLQKQEFNYVYQPSQNPTSAQASYVTQPPIPNNYYPNLPVQPAQYYTQDQQVYSGAPQVYSGAPQVNFAPQQNAQSFVPLSFVPNPGYQAKYQLIPSKSPNGQIQLTVIPQQSILTPPPVYPGSQLYNSPTQAQVQQPIPGNPFVSSFLSQPTLGYQYPQGLVQGQGSQMVLYQPQYQPNTPVLSNYLYSNPAQQLLNYYQSNPQAKYQLLLNQQQTQSQDFDKPGSTVTRISKEENEINLTNDYLPAESSTSYKDTYSVARGSSYKSS